MRSCFEEKKEQYPGLKLKFPVKYYLMEEKVRPLDQFAAIISHSKSYTPPACDVPSIKSQPSYAHEARSLIAVHAWLVTHRRSHLKKHANLPV